MGAVRNTGCLYLIDNTELSPQIRLYVFIRADTIWYHLAPSGRTLSGESTRTPRVCGAKFTNYENLCLLVNARASANALEWPITRRNRTLSRCVFCLAQLPPMPCQRRSGSTFSDSQ
jgi:hypothetical protein